MTSLRSSNSRLWGQPLQCLHLPIQVDKHINENFPGSWFCYVGLARMTLFYLLCRWHEEDEACWCDTKCPGDHHGQRPNCMYASWIWLTCSVIAHIIVIGTSVWASGFCNITHYFVGPGLSMEVSATVNLPCCSGLVSAPLQPAVKPTWLLVTTVIHVIYSDRMY